MEVSFNDLTEVIDELINDRHRIGDHYMSPKVGNKSI